METRLTVRFNMYDMEYRGGSVESKLPLIPLEKKYYEQYKKIVDDCYFEMRKSLDIKPYEKHSNSLEDITKLKQHTFMLLNGDEIICAVTCSLNDIENVVVNPKYQGRGYGRKVMQFAISYMQKRGDCPIKLAVMKWNENAVRLYKSLGFEVVKETTVEGVNTLDTEGKWSFEFIETGNLNIR